MICNKNQFSLFMNDRMLPFHSSEIRGLCLMKMIQRNASKFATFLEYENQPVFSFFLFHAINFTIHQEKIKYINSTKCRFLYSKNVANFGCNLLGNSIKHKPLTISEECSPLLSVYTRHVGRVSNYSISTMYLLFLFYSKKTYNLYFL